MRGQSANNLIDQVWSLALDTIMKGAEPLTSRPELGDELDLAVAQAGTTALLARVPAFTKLLYNSGYEAASRNTYLVLRRLGMPSDFFWKFDYWDEDRAFETLNKVLTRVFTSLLSKQKEGELRLVSVDPEHGTFDIAFDGCAECAGLSSRGAMCFYHAGSFAGIVAAMLNRDLDAYEVECVAAGGESCRFNIGGRAARDTVIHFDRWIEEFTVEYEAARRFEACFAGREVRSIGNMVNVGYYQMVLASSVLTNLDVVERACFEAGQDIGRSLAPIVRERFAGEATAALGEFYRRLRYTDLAIRAADGGFEISVREAPEHLGPLEQSALVPFLSGELVGLLSELSGASLHLADSQVTGRDLTLRLLPQV